MPRRSAAMGARNSTISNTEPPLEEDNKSQALTQLQEGFSKFHFHCRSCQADFSPDDLKSNIEPWFDLKDPTPTAGARPPSPHYTAVKCSTCSASTCVGCGRKPRGHTTRTTPFNVSMNSCCEKGRLLVIWLVLCRFDDRELELQASTTKANDTPPKSSTKKSSAAKKKAALAQFYPPDTGIGYSIGHGTGLTSKEIAAAKLSDDSDRQMIATLALLEKLLEPKEDRTSPLLDVQDELAFFRASFLLNRICALVRNDSIWDLTDRSILYNGLFSFIHSVSNYPRLVQILFEPQPSRKASPGLRALTSGSSGGQDASEVTADQSPSIFSCFSYSYQQANVFLDLAKNIKQAKSKLGSGTDSIVMCKTIIKLYTTLDEKNPHLASSACVVDEMKSPWIEFSEANRVTFTDDVLVHHRFKQTFPSLKSSNQNRMLVIGREISSMTTSLPAGVFVKVAESRSDVMKVLIIGVEGSPYAGGLFNFDLLLPSDYPKSPPKMAFVLEGVDFEYPPMNPNLHPGGTICLSILNTWSGEACEMWQPGQSTILAVLVSIQSMILGAPLPWLNEPGYATQGITPQAIAHKLQIQAKTVRYAMVAWLMKIQGMDGKVPADVWQDIIEVYWKYNKQNVLDTVEKWAPENPLIKSYNKIVLSSLPTFATDPSQAYHRGPVAAPLATDDLIQTLRTLLDMEQSQDADPQAEGSSRAGTTGEASANKKDTYKGKRKASANSENSKHGNKAGSSKRKKIEDIEEDDGFDNLHYESDLDNEEDDDHYITSGVPGGGGLEDQAHNEAAVYLALAQLEDVVLKWVYTGGKSLKDVRAACEEFGITAARSIAETITRIENHVNKEIGTLDVGLMVKYGMIGDEDVFSDY